MTDEEESALRSVYKAALLYVDRTTARHGPSAAPARMSLIAAVGAAKTTLTEPSGEPLHVWDLALASSLARVDLYTGPRQAETLTVARAELFAPFERSSGFARWTMVEIDHGGVCLGHRVGADDESWYTSQTSDGRQYQKHVDEILKRAKEIGITVEVSIKVIDHVGRCRRCKVARAASSASVVIQWGIHRLVREYAL